MKQSIKYLISFSFIFASCASIERPNTNLCIVNAQSNQLRCYNMKNDYTDKGVLKLDAEPHFKVISGVEDLHKHLCLDPDSTANLKAYLQKISYRVKDFE